MINKERIKKSSIIALSLGGVINLAVFISAVQTKSDAAEEHNRIWASQYELRKETRDEVKSMRQEMRHGFDKVDKKLDRLYLNH